MLVIKSFDEAINMISDIKMGLLVGEEEVDGDVLSPIAQQHFLSALASLDKVRVELTLSKYHNMQGK